MPRRGGRLETIMTMTNIYRNLLQVQDTIEQTYNLLDERNNAHWAARQYVIDAAEYVADALEVLRVLVIKEQGNLELEKMYIGHHKGISFFPH